MLELKASWTIFRLSGGQKATVAIAGIIALRPKMRSVMAYNEAAHEKRTKTQAGRSVHGMMIC